MAVKEKHSHYYKNVTHLADIDAYRVLERFGVTHPSIQHAVKKLLVAGGRGAGKDQDQDVQEAIDSLQRFQEMRIEDTRERHDAAAHDQFGAVTVVNNLGAGVGFDTPEMREAFRKALEGIPRPVAPKKPVRKMSPVVKKELARRKATKRAAKPAARRGR